MRETVEATRRPLAMERVSYDGEFRLHLDDVVEIDIVHGDRLPKHVPIYTVPRACRWSRRRDRRRAGAQLHGRPVVRRPGDGRAGRRCREGGRTVLDIDRPQLVVCLAGPRPRVALDRSRELLTQYLGQQPHIMKAGGWTPP